MPDSEGTVTLIGQSKSGKTHYLSALLTHPGRVHDLLEGPDAAEAAVLEILPDLDENLRMDRENLISHFDNILKGKDSFEGRNQGTDQARTYRARLDLTRKVPVQRLLGAPVLQSRSSTVSFDIVDGRGGDLAPNEYTAQTRRDEAFMARRTAYRDAVTRSEGLIICLTIAPDEYDAAMGERLLQEFRLAIDLKRKAKNSAPFRNIALCLTKYETAFAADDNGAGIAARDRRRFIETARNSAGVRQFADVLRRGGEDGGYRTAVFPVSTYGFIDGYGAPNWYGYTWAPGLRTRVVDEYDLTNDDLPDYRDHFPEAVSQDKALRLWQPFNLAPPLVFALTGELTGPAFAMIQDFRQA